MLKLGYRKQWILPFNVMNKVTPNTQARYMGGYPTLLPWIVLINIKLPLDYCILIYSFE